MLKFAQYRRERLVEADAPVLDPETEKRAARLRSEAGTKPATPAPAKAAMPSPLIPELEKTVDDFVNQLKMQLAMPSGPESQRGVWDRMKGWWSNLWYGRYNQQNPYYWKNKLGDDMGRTVESVTPIPLSHYAILREQAMLLELALPSGAEKLQVMKVIDSWAKNFKTAIMRIVNKHNEPVNVPPAPGVDSTPTTRPPEVTSDERRAATPPPAKPPEAAPGERRPEHMPPVVVSDEKKKEEEPATPPAVDNERQKRMMVDLEALKDKMPSKTYDTLKRHIESGDEEQMNLVQIVLDKKRVAPLDSKDKEAPPEQPKEKLPPEKKVDDESSLPPKSDGREWKDLSPHDRELWDQAGGGNAGDASFHARHHLDIRTLPWIMRIGDPRLAHIEKIPGRSLYNRLVRQKRIENPAHPITTVIQLEKAVEEAKQLASQEAERISSDRKQRHARFRLRKNIRDRLESSPPDKGTGTGTDKLKPPRIAPLNPGEEPKDDIQADIASARKEILAMLEEIKDDTDEAAYAQLKKWIESDDPARIKRAKENIKILMQKITPSKEKEEEKSAYDAPEGSGNKGFEDALAAEWTLRDKNMFVISSFRRMVNEHDKNVPRATSRNRAKLAKVC